MKNVSRVGSWAGVLFFACAAWAAIRLAVADTIFREDTVQAVKQAITVQGAVPAAAFEERLAELDPDHEGQALEQAVDNNPRATNARIALGMLEERNGNIAAAERSYLEAARLDHQYLPAWTLSNYYFRRANRKSFWLWADRAASLTYDDYRPLLDLCDRLESDPSGMLSHFRDVPRLRPHYLNFLIGRDRLEAAQTVAFGMLEDRANDPFLIDLADRQLRAGNAPEAMELWNAASGLGRIEPTAGRILTNGDLGRAPSNMGFDWRLGRVKGVAAQWRPSELTFTLSGTQPEACNLLEQTIYLAPPRLCLRFSYRTGAEPLNGIHWALDNTEGPGLERSEQWRDGVFDVPQDRGLAQLRLFYRRDEGTTRSEGRIEIRNLRLERSDQAPIRRTVDAGRD